MQIVRDGEAVITRRAISFLAKKIATLSGDLRKALDVCTRSLEMAETMVWKMSKLQRQVTMFRIVDMSDIMKVSD